MENRTAAIWARVSSPGQRDLSLDSQIAEVKPWLESQGYIVPDNRIIRAVWTSLDVLSCPDAQVLLDWIRKGEIAALGIYHGDRLSGKPSHKALLLEQCHKYGVTVLSKNSPLVEGREGELVDYVITWGKETSVLRSQLGAKHGLRDRALLKHLPPTMKEPYGYSWKDATKPKLIPDEDYDSANLILRLLLQGRSLKAVGRELRQRGIPSPRGKLTWSPSSIRAVAINPTYAGWVAALKYERVEPRERRKKGSGKTSHRTKPQDEWHWLEGFVESPIITWDEHVAIVERLKLNKLYAGRNAKRNYLLRGLIECQLCHRHYYGVQGTRQRPAYVCSASWAQTYGKRCQAKPLGCSDIEPEVKEKIRSFLESPDVYLAEADQRAELTQHTVGNIEQSIRDLERQYQQTIEAERKALKSLTDEAFSQEQALIKARRTWLRDEIERQKAKLAQLHQGAINRETVEAMRRRLHTNLDQASDEDWRRILEALGTRILAFGDGAWDIEINIPTADANCLQNSLVYLSLATS